MESIRRIDPEIESLIQKEALRQATVLRLIPSENYASQAVMAACGSCLSNKYSEGYPNARYYQGQEYIDQIELLAIKRAKELFSAEHANVQPYSGSPANMAIYLATMNPGECSLGMDLASGGHLTHGAKVSFSGKIYDVKQYGLSKQTHRIDMDQVRELAKKHRPKLIFAGCSAYPRKVDFEAFALIAREVGAVLAADISHFSALCATGFHPAPFPHADIVSSTTHKILRGPRGGMLMCKKEFAAKLDKAVFPGLQGGPHNNTTAAIAVALKEAQQPEFTEYCGQVIKNAAALAEALLAQGFELVTGGTDNHLVLIDANNQGITGKQFAVALDQAGIVCNYNKVPFDFRTANDPSGVRLGTPALTSRGMKQVEMVQVAALIKRVAEAPFDEANLVRVKSEVAELCTGFPAPGLPS
jgi:glycine hydroxymethyltransferase